MAGLLGPRVGAGASISFLRWTNSLYSTAAAMAQNAAAAKAGLPEKDFFWGQYQKRVRPKAGDWPKFAYQGRRVNTFSVWDADVQRVRASLEKQPNRQPVTPNDPRNVPTNRCDLLDAAVRMAFYADPPIPKVVDVGQTHGPEHEIELGWSQDASGNLVRLHVTVRCPVRKEADA